MVRTIQTGGATIQRYHKGEELDDATELPTVRETTAWMREETESTISERSYFAALPVLINAKIKNKTTREILSHYRSALQQDAISDTESETPSNASGDGADTNAQL